MLTENSIKTNIVMGKMLTIEIRAELIIIFLIIRKYVKTGTASGSITLHPVSVLP